MAKRSEGSGSEAAYAQRYARWTRPFAGYPRRVALLSGVNKALTGLFYLAYGLLLLVVSLTVPLRLAPLILMPGAAFALVSLVRRRFNAPRPFEICAIVPLISREGAGESFPSRHVFSAFTIATCWFTAVGPVALGLLVAAAALAWCRVIGGVHFPRDVVAGAALGLATGLVATALATLC